MDTPKLRAIKEEIKKRLDKKFNNGNSGFASIPQAKVNRYAGIINKQTDQNKHGEAIRSLGKLLGDGTRVKKLDAIIKEADKAGHLTSALRARRDKIRNELWEIGKKTLTPAQWDKIYGSF